MSDEDTKSWIYSGGLPYELTEGDIICVFSQYGEILEMNLSRDKETGKSRGFCFIKYEDPKSCELAVDNFQGATILGRKIKVSHANNSNALKSKRPAIVAPQSPNSRLDFEPKREKEAKDDLHFKTEQKEPRSTHGSRQRKLTDSPQDDSLRKRSKDFEPYGRYDQKVDGARDAHKSYRKSPRSHHSKNDSRSSRRRSRSRDRYSPERSQNYSSRKHYDRYRHRDDSEERRLSAHDRRETHHTRRAYDHKDRVARSRSREVHHKSSRIYETSEKERKRSSDKKRDHAHRTHETSRRT